MFLPTCFRGKEESFNRQFVMFHEPMKSLVRPPLAPSKQSNRVECRAHYFAGLTFGVNRPVRVRQLGVGEVPGHDLTSSRLGAARMQNSEWSMRPRFHDGEVQDNTVRTCRTWFDAGIL